MLSCYQDYNTLSMVIIGIYSSLTLNQGPLLQVDNSHLDCCITQSFYYPLMQLKLCMHNSSYPWSHKSDHYSDLLQQMNLHNFFRPHKYIRDNCHQDSFLHKPTKGSEQKKLLIERSYKKDRSQLQLLLNNNIEIFNKLQDLNYKIMMDPREVHQNQNRQSRYYGAKKQQLISSSLSNTQQNRLYSNSRSYTQYPPKRQIIQSIQQNYSNSQVRDNQHMQSSSKSQLPIIYNSSARSNKSKQSDSSRILMNERRDGGSRVIYESNSQNNIIKPQSPTQFIQKSYTPPKSEINSQRKRQARKQYQQKIYPHDPSEYNRNISPQQLPNTDHNNYVYKTRIIPQNQIERSEMTMQVAQRIPDQNQVPYQASKGVKQGSRIKVYSQITNQPIYIDANSLSRSKNLPENSQPTQMQQIPVKANHQIKCTSPPVYPPQQKNTQAPPTFKNIPQGYQYHNAISQSQFKQHNQQSNSSRIQMLSTQSVPRIQYEKCVNQCKNWQTRYNQLYLKFMNLAASYQELASTNEASQNSSVLQQQIAYLQRDNQQLQQQLVLSQTKNKKAFQIIENNFNAMVHKQQEAAMKQTQLLIQRYKLENKGYR